MDKVLILVAGPTASGKTALAIRLAQELGTEIISADARQVYREMRIGTAMPTAAELAAAPHHLIGHRSVIDRYVAADYGGEAEKIAAELFRKYNSLILCGGSGLYIKAFLEGLDEIPEVPEAIRNEIIESYEKLGLNWLQQETEQADPQWYRDADQSNPRRMMRALEVFRSSGKPLSSFQTGSSKRHDFRVIKIGLEWPRQELGERIDNRVDRMVADGLFAEVAQLIPHRALPALQTVGYREVFQFLDSNISREESIRLIKQHTRQYAKRQMTWFRKEEGISWFDSSRTGDILSHIRERMA